MIIQQLLEGGRQVRRITASKHKRGEGPLRIWYSEVSVKCEWRADWQTHGVYVKYATVQGDWLTKTKDGVTMDGNDGRYKSVGKQLQVNRSVSPPIQPASKRGALFLPSPLLVVWVLHHVHA